MKQLKMIRPIALCVALLLLLLLCPATANAAAEGTCGEHVAWTLDDAGTLTISGTGPMEDYLNSQPPWYALRHTVKTVVIEDGVTYVGAWTFINMRSVTDVTIGKNVTEIGEFAFSCSNLSTVTLPEGLKVIGESAFEYCDMLTQITVPDSVTTIGIGAFSNCFSLTDVTLGSGLETIGDCAFLDCSVSDIYYRGTEETWENISIGSYNEGLLNAQLHYVNNLSGNMDGDAAVTTDDAVYLLLSVMFGTDDYPVPAGTSLDFDGSGTLDTDDAVYLLLHIMFGAEDYPLPA